MARACPSPSSTSAPIRLGCSSPTSEDGEVVELERRTIITRLGQDVDATGRLADEAMDRVAEAIAGIAR